MDSSNTGATCKTFCANVDGTLNDYDYSISVTPTADSGLMISGTRIYNRIGTETIILTLNKLLVKGKGVYNLGSSNSGVLGQTGGTGGGENYTTDTQHTGQVTITAFDQTTRKVSGTFSFTSTSLLSFSSVYVSEGAFKDIDF